MTDRDENKRIDDAKSRIYKLTFENDHLIKQIEGLKKEINSVEANKERLIAQLAGSETRSPGESDREFKHDGSESESLLSSNPVSTISLSEFSDTGSSISSLSSQSASDCELLRRHRSLETTLSSDFKRYFDKVDYCSASTLRPVDFSNLNFESISWLQKFIRNLNEVKYCFSTDDCENNQLLEVKFSALQEVAYKRMEVLMNNNRSNPTSTNTMSENCSKCSGEGVNNLNQPVESGHNDRKLFSFYYLFNFLSIPFLFVLGCGYFGLMLYLKQLDTCFLVTPPQ